MGKRLGDNGSKMADQSDELCASNANEFSNYIVEEDMKALLSKMDRPVHQALKTGKILCPKDTCVEKMNFFEPNGIDHYFCVKHNEQFMKNDMDDSARICHLLYEKETKEYLQVIFEHHKQRYVILAYICYLSAKVDKLRDLI